MLSAGKVLLCCLCVRKGSILGHYFTLLFNSPFFCQSFQSWSLFFTIEWLDKGCSFSLSHMHIQHFEIFIRVYFKLRMRSFLLFLQRQLLRSSFYLHPSVEQKSRMRLDQGPITDSASNLPSLYAEIEVTAKGCSCNILQKGKKRCGVQLPYSHLFPSFFHFLCCGRWLRAKQAILTKHSENNSAVESGQLTWKYLSLLSLEKKIQQWWSHTW